MKGYIYIEAYKQPHVKAAIENVGNLRMGIWKQQMVPIKEMTDVLRVVKEQTGLKAKQWVRLKRGIYKDDIAQVDYVDLAQNQVHLKLLPRIDYTRPRGALRTAQSESEALKRKKKRRPAAKPFDPEAIRAIGGEVTSDGDFLIFEGNRYSRKGFVSLRLAVLCFHPWLLELLSIKYSYFISLVSCTKISPQVLLLRKALNLRSPNWRDLRRHRKASR